MNTNRMTSTTCLSFFLAATCIAQDKPLIMKQYTVKDVKENREQPLVRLLVPQGWQAQSQVRWTLASVMAPHSYWARFTSPEGSARVEFLPINLGRKVEQPGLLPQGQASPKNVREGLLMIARRYRPDAQIKVLESSSSKVKSETMQSTADALSYRSDQTGRIVIQYRLGTKVLEEELTGTLSIVELRTSWGSSTQDWFMHDLRAIRASQGKLKTVIPVGVAMARSAQTTPEFALAIEFAKQCVVKIFYHKMHHDKLDAELWHRTRQEISDNWRKTVQERWISQQRQYEQMNDILGGVQRFRDGEGHEFLLPTTHEYAWKGPNETFLLTNDPYYRPDVHFTGTWDSLKPKSR